jgi:hypothetical protein
LDEPFCRISAARAGRRREKTALRGSGSKTSISTVPQQGLGEFALVSRQKLTNPGLDELEIDFFDLPPGATRKAKL